MCLVVVTSIWLLNLRSNVLPMHPKRLRLSRSRVAWVCLVVVLVCRVLLACLTRVAWPVRLARGLRAVVRCSVLLVR